MKNNQDDFEGAETVSGLGAVTLALLIAAMMQSGCGFMGVKRMELWKGGPNWENAINQEWALSTREIPAVVAKRALAR